LRSPAQVITVQPDWAALETEDVLERLAALEQEYDDVETRLSAPDIHTDQKLVRDLSRRHKELKR